MSSYLLLKLHPPSPLQSILNPLKQILEYKVNPSFEINMLNLTHSPCIY